MKGFYDLTPQGRSRRLHRIARLALESYPLPDPQLRVMSTETNAVFRVDTSAGRYVLRIGRGGNIGHSLEQVRSEAAFLAALSAAEVIRAPAPVCNSEGDFVTRVELAGVPDRRNCMLFEWLPGRLLDGRLTLDHVRQYGSLAARLHMFAESFRPPECFSIVRYDRVFPFDEPVVVFDPQQAAFVTGRQRELFRAAADIVQDAIDDLRRRESPRVVHGDLHRWNILIDHGTMAAFDFEDLMWGWPVQDLAIALYYLEGEDNYRELLTAFQTGYEHVRDWPDRTGREIDTFIAGRALVLANDVELLEEPEYRAAAPEWMAGFASRISSLLRL
jgi:Ser/Thr protein kinase RdoA (MazF antagonist)